MRECSGHVYFQVYLLTLNKYNNKMPHFCNLDVDYSYIRELQDISKPSVKEDLINRLL